MITIKNLRNEKPKNPYDFYIDRRSPLGNPFFLKNEKDRVNVCNKYEEYFYNKIDAKIDKNFILELELFESIYKVFGKLNLFCWCYPKQCHGETIKKFLEKDNIC
jgi:hypothetical protein